MRVKSFVPESPCVQGGSKNQASTCKKFWLHRYKLYSKAHMISFTAYSRLKAPVAIVCDPRSAVRSSFFRIGLGRFPKIY